MSSTQLARIVVRVARRFPSRTEIRLLSGLPVTTPSRIAGRGLTVHRLQAALPWPTWGHSGEVDRSSDCSASRRGPRGQLVALPPAGILEYTLGHVRRRASRGEDFSIDVSGVSRPAGRVIHARPRRPLHRPRGGARARGAAAAAPVAQSTGAQRPWLSSRARNGLHHSATATAWCGMGVSGLPPPHRPR